MFYVNQKEKFNYSNANRFFLDSAKDHVYNVIQHRKNYVNYNFVTISNFMLTYYVNHTIYMNLWFM